MQAMKGQIQSTNSGASLQLSSNIVHEGAGQSRTASLAEAGVNVVVGYVIALALQIAMFPLFGLHADLAGHAGIAMLFTVASLARSFTLRRLFQHIHDKRVFDRERRARSLEERLATGRLT